mmetsp:Transcript_50256/g.129373  ORF Transcript_50256/g.129373 Transcript_50256/m.129373 type:complete len:230 (+) Transcript_50256:782-1471(+)
MHTNTSSNTDMMSVSSWLCPACSIDSTTVFATITSMMAISNKRCRASLLHTRRKALQPHFLLRGLPSGVVEVGAGEYGLCASRSLSDRTPTPLRASFPFPPPSTSTCKRGGAATPCLHPTLSTFLFFPLFFLSIPLVLCERLSSMVERSSSPSSFSANGTCQSMFATTFFIFAFHLTHLPSTFAAFGELTLSEAFSPACIWRVLEYIDVMTPTNSLMRRKLPKATNTTK